MRLGGYEWDFRKIYIMGILNVTPDSFSDGGNYMNLDSQLYRAEQMIQEGADILDIGGESTRPGAEAVTAEEEKNRVLPIVEAIHSRFEIPISVDTYKAEVAGEAIERGAGMINDIWGGSYDQKMAPMVAAHPDVAFCLMHNRRNAQYRDFSKEVVNDLHKSLGRVLDAGVNPGQLLIDPGIGFAKSHEQNLYLLNHLEILKELGYPILLGTSRKRIVGLTLNLPTEERLEGTLATNVIGMMKGARVLRVHDVKAHRRLADMTEAVLQAE